MNDLFVDRLVNISVISGVARLNFARVDSVSAEDKKVELSNSYRIAMPLDALMHLAEQSSKIAEEIKKNQAAISDHVARR